MDDPSPPLTSLAHGGGCGCKLSPAVLQQLLAGMPGPAALPSLLVGLETGDDAAVWRLNAEQALVATTDFFTPVVDDPFDFGRIAATNALSDVYAMGGTPILALAVLGMPLAKLSADTVRAILAGGASVCAAACVPVAGGHSIDSAEPIYGLVALGLVHPDRVLRNATARAGDRLILTKGLGVGIFSAALKQQRLEPDDYRTMISSTTQLNRLGAELAALDGVHAVTDVTGFGLLGHVLEVCRGSGKGARIELDAVPVLPGAATLAAQGVRTGAATRNWASYGEAVDWAAAAPKWRQDLLCDPQTSGGLLIAVAPEAEGALIERARAAGFSAAASIGTVVPGPARVQVL